MKRPGNPNPSGHGAKRFDSCRSCKGIRSSALGPLPINLFLAGLLFFGCTTGPPGSPRPSSNFLLYTNALPPQARNLNHTAQTYLEQLGSYLGLSPAPGALLRIHQYRWRLNFWRHLNGAYPSLRWKKGACFETLEAYVVAVYGQPGSNKMLETLRHELTHYLLTIHFSQIPPWIDEGLAQVMACGPPLPHLDRGLSGKVRDAVIGGQTTSCERLLAIPPGRSLTRNQYHLACALTYFLLTRSNDSRDRLLCFLNSTQPGKIQGEAFRTCWGLSMEQACRDLTAWSD